LDGRNDDLDNELGTSVLEVYEAVWLAIGHYESPGSIEG